MSKRMMAMFVAVIVLQPALGPVLLAQTREGIKVHGHWVIDVRNPDGTLVSHNEIENALMPHGAFLLGNLLGRRSTIGKWVVSLPNGPCLAIPSTQCSLAEPPIDLYGNVGTLQVSVLGNGLVLRGSFTALRTAAISRVETFARYCNPNIAAESCSGDNMYSFSGTDLPPVSVQVDQIVQITVTLSFS